MTLEDQIQKMEIDHARAIEILLVRNSDQVSLIQSLTLQLDEARAASMTADKDRRDNEALRARVEALVAQSPFNTRVLRPGAFMKRLAAVVASGGANLFMLFGSEDAVIRGIVSRLKEYESEKWEVQLDCDEIKNGLGYLVATGNLSIAQSAELTRDAAREESVTL